MMGSYLSNSVISEVTLDFVLLPVLDAVTMVISWLYSVVDVVDKCFDSMPRGPAGFSHGSFAEVEFTINSTDSSSSDNNQSIGAKIRNSLKLVELGSIHNSGVSSKHHVDCEGSHSSGCGDHVCAVCLGDINWDEKVYELTQCDHIFHSACLDRWVGHNHHTCPLCRTSLISGSSCSNMGGGAIMMQDEEGMVDEDPGFSLGIWFSSQYAMNINFDSRSWTHTVMRLAGF
ncbi:unnamed protein product [Calypogeia fissa]